MQRSIFSAFTMITSLLLSGCIGAPDKPVKQQAAAPFASPGQRLCLSQLRATDVQFSALPNQTESNGCRTIDTIKLLDFGTEATNLGAMTCPLAANFAAWARNAAQPAARIYFGSELVRIETLGTYNCRTVNGQGRTRRLSQHAFGNAVDVAAFILADGRRVSLLHNWRGNTKESAFLKRLHASACKRFGTVLGPDYNAAHANHFHFDMGKSTKNGSTYCR